MVKNSAYPESVFVVHSAVSFQVLFQHRSYICVLHLFNQDFNSNLLNFCFYQISVSRYTCLLIESDCHAELLGYEMCLSFQRKGQQTQAMVFIVWETKAASRRVDCLVLCAGNKGTSCVAWWRLPGHACCPRAVWIRPPSTTDTCCWPTSSPNSPFTNASYCR